MLGLYRGLGYERFEFQAKEDQHRPREKNNLSGTGREGHEVLGEPRYMRL